MSRIKYKPNHLNLDYLKGIVITDGHINKNNGVRITSARDEYADIYKELGYSVRRYKNSGKGQFIYDIRIGNLEFAETHLNMTVGKTFVDLQVEDTGYFLAGVIDGNGYVSKSRAEVEVTTHLDRTDILDVFKLHFDNLNMTYGVYYPTGKRMVRLISKNIPSVTNLAKAVADKMLIKEKRELLQRYL